MWSQKRDCAGFTRLSPKRGFDFIILGFSADQRLFLQVQGSTTGLCHRHGQTNVPILSQHHEAVARQDPCRMDLLAEDTKPRVLVGGPQERLHRRRESSRHAPLRGSKARGKNAGNPTAHLPPASAVAAPQTPQRLGTARATFGHSKFYVRNFRDGAWSRASTRRAQRRSPGVVAPVHPEDVGIVQSVAPASHDEEQPRARRRDPPRPLDLVCDFRLDVRLPPRRRRRRLLAGCPVRPAHALVMPGGGACCGGHMTDPTDRVSNYFFRLIGVLSSVISLRFRREIHMVIRDR